MGTEDKPNRWIPIYGEWMIFKQSPKDPYMYILEIYRDKQINPKFIEKLNREFTSCDIRILVKKDDVPIHYNELQEVIAKEVANKKQGQLTNIPGICQGNNENTQEEKT